AGCSPTFGPGGTGTRTDSEEGPSDAAAVLDEAQVAELPDDAIPETTEPAAPEGYVWAWEVTFSAPRDQAEAWPVASFGSAPGARPADAPPVRGPPDGAHAPEPPRPAGRRPSSPPPAGRLTGPAACSTSRPPPAGLLAPR